MTDIETNTETSIGQETGLMVSVPSAKPVKGKSIRKRKTKVSARKKTKTRASSRGRSKIRSRSRSSSRRKSRMPIFGKDTVMAAMVRFMQRPQGATHKEMERKFKLDGPDERGRFWHIINDFGFKVKKLRNNDEHRPGRKVFHIATA